LNEALTSAYVHAGATVPDVAATFRIDDFDHTVAVPGQYGSRLRADLLVPIVTAFLDAPMPERD
jgi:hypothetical protein